MDPMEALVSGGGTDEEEQRQLAAQLRAMSELGALGSTSQIKEVGATAQDVSRRAQTAAIMMGQANQAKEGREALILREAMRARKSPTTGARGLPRATGKGYDKLTGAERERLTKSAGLMHELQGLTESFKPEYANQTGLGFMESMVQSGMTNEPVLTQALAKSGVGKMIGMDKALENGQNMEEEQEWWRLYERVNKIPERADKFGATLTREELRSWNNADIKPGQTADQIQRNLNARLGIMQAALKRRADSMSALNYPQEAIDAVMGDLLSEVYPDMGAAIEGTSGIGQSPTTENFPVPQGEDPNEWNELTDDEKQFFYENMGQ